MCEHKSGFQGAAGMSKNLRAIVKNKSKVRWFEQVSKHFVTRVIYIYTYIIIQREGMFFATNLKKPRDFAS